MRVRKWICDQCGADITDRTRLYRVKMEEPGLDTKTEGGRWKARMSIRCRKKDMCHACYDKLWLFLGEKEEEK